MEELRESTRAYLEGRDYRAHGAAASLRLQPLQPQHQDRPGDRLQRRRDQGDAARRARSSATPTCASAPPACACRCCARTAIALTFECERPITPDEVRAILADAPGVRIVDDRERNYFPMPLDASGQDDILVGRIRQDLSDPSGRSIALFVAGDQLLKGAALNAVQIAERLLH